MGYRTSYNLDIYNGDGTPVKDEIKNNLVKELQEESDDAKNALDGDGSYKMEIGSEDIVDDIQEFSKKYHELRFELNYTGDGDDDFGYIYFKNGKKQDDPAQITFDGFDELKLK